MLVLLHLLASCSDPSSPAGDTETDPVDDPAPEPPAGTADHVVINEVVAYAQDGAGSDWLELHNPTEETADLSGYLLLSQDGTEQTPWSFPDGTTIGAGGHLVVYCDEGASTTDELHASFRIGRHEPWLVLSSSTGTAVDEVEGPDFENDTAYARIPDGAETWVKTRGTSAGAANGRLVSATAFGTLRDRETAENGTAVASCDCDTGSEGQIVVEFDDAAVGGASWATLVLASTASAFTDGAFNLFGKSSADGALTEGDWVDTSVATPTAAVRLGVGDTDSFPLPAAGAYTLVVASAPCGAVCVDTGARGVAASVEVAAAWLAIPE